MMRRRAERRATPLSTLPALPAGNADAGTSHRRRSLRGLRRLMLRLGVLRSTVLVTVVTTVSSIGIALIAGAFASLPPDLLRYSLTMAAATPLLISPPIAWYVTRLMLELDEARRFAERLAVTDPLTQAFNRRHFFDVGERALARSRDEREPLSVLLIDVDHFKVVNDEHGHAVGDLVLKAVARTCMDGMQEHELLARFGGEEFVVLLPGSGLVDAASVAERLRGAIERLAVPADESAIVHPTVSIGVASATPRARSLDGLLASADHAMYEAKRGGRNRVMAEHADPLAS